MTISCQEVVELVTDYLEGQRTKRPAPSWRRTSRCVPAATSTWSR